MNKRLFLAIKHNNYATLCSLESIATANNFAPLTARSYPALMDTYLDNRFSVVAILYQFYFRGEQFPQERRIIYPAEIINNITAYKKNIPIFALSSSNPENVMLSSLLSYGVREILPLSLNLENLEQALNRAGIEKPKLK